MKKNKSLWAVQNMFGDIVSNSIRLVRSEARSFKRSEYPSGRLVKLVQNGKSLKVVPTR